MRAAAPVFLLLPSLCFGLAMTLGYWMRLPWPLLAGLGVLWVAVLAAMPSGRRQPRFARSSLVGVGLGTGIVLGSAMAFHRTVVFWFQDVAAAAGLVAVALLLTSARVRDEAGRGRWRAWFMGWAILGTVLSLVTAYRDNSRGVFFCSLVIWLTLLVLWKRWFTLRTLAVQAINTATLLTVGVPVASFLWSPSDQLNIYPDLDEEPYRYENARKDPAAFARYWREYHKEIFQFDQVFMRGRDGRIHLRPNMVISFFDSRIRINSQGFRGREIPEKKGDTYRIVALGESTTYGIILGPDERPWPEVLEELIQERLDPQRPVEVINAGIPGFSLKENLNRLASDILPLQPDLIISYHGLNGFYMLYKGLPPTRGRPPPSYRQRPLTLLADFEYQLKTRRYRSQYSPHSRPRPAYLASPMDSQYARCYRQLIRATHTNGIRLALATFAMSIDGRSPRDVVSFYRMMDPGAGSKIKIDEAHNSVVRQLAAKNPDVCLIDTVPALDGQWRYFIDLVHFNQEGRELMAETMLDGIQDILEEDLAGEFSRRRLDSGAR